MTGKSKKTSKPVKNQPPQNKPSNTNTPSKKTSNVNNNNNSKNPVPDYDKNLIDKDFLNYNLDQLKNTQRYIDIDNDYSQHSNIQQQQQQQTTKSNGNSLPNNSNISNLVSLSSYESIFNDLPPVALYSFRFGNNEFYQERYKQAIEYYNTAIANLHPNHSLFIVILLINRSISKLKNNEYKKSILDSTLALSIQPNCIKAYICRYFGYFFTRDFKKAFSDQFIAMSLCPKNITLQQIMRYSFGSTFIYNTASIQEIFKQSIGSATPTTSGINKIWISDFGKLTIEEEPSRMNLLIHYYKRMNSVYSKSTSVLDSQDLYQQQQQQQLLQKSSSNGKQDQLPPPLIPYGEFSYGTNWSDYEEYHANRKTTVAETIASKQKLYGNTDFQDKNFIAALGHYTKAIKLNPNDSIYYSNRGIVYYKLNRFLEAITDCTISIEKQSQQFKAYLRRGSSYVAIGDYGLAVQDFRSGLRYEPESIDLLECLYKALKHIEHDIRLQLNSDPKSESLNQTLKELIHESSHLNTKLTSSKDTVNSQVKVNTPPPLVVNPKPTTPPLQSTSPQQPQQPNSVTQSTNSPTVVVINNKTNRTTYYRPTTKDQKEKQMSLVKYLSYLIDNKVGNLLNAYLSRGEAHLQLGDLKSAIADYESGLEIDPKDQDLQSRLTIVKSLL
ncbi:hypothetical protein DLAC_01783 [Tieghemostelium lacteum]|uniref:Tetratricopeptide-like helical domain-containing protein (TPR) n=1 Tax=Tieghemostelium lacteum TaxID=361077 RepID=A0A152A6M8_TIELA|nr:hypothetical protein DLAC_01783 [Tieghemostelium lacteum]|eukprot:KYR01771.1 hypothetical protein DLAC_01783 [Tieghemostelium lacteum]